MASRKGNQAPVGSRWTFNTDTTGRVFVVIERKPFGGVEIKQEGEAYFGSVSLRSLLATATRLPDAPESAESPATA